jgi:hypothetical protein
MDRFKSTLPICGVKMANEHFSHEVSSSTVNAKNASRDHSDFSKFNTSHDTNKIHDCVTKETFSTYVRIHKDI